MAGRLNYRNRALDSQAMSDDSLSLTTSNTATFGVECLHFTTCLSNPRNQA